jgi:hypothetical protein
MEYSDSLPNIDCALSMAKSMPPHLTSHYSVYLVQLSKVEPNLAFLQTRDLPYLAGKGWWESVVNVTEPSRIIPSAMC